MASSPRVCPAARTGSKCQLHGFIVLQPVGPIEKLHAQEQSFINYNCYASPQMEQLLSIKAI